MNKQAEDYFFTWFDNCEKRLRVFDELLDDLEFRLDDNDKKLDKIKKWVEEIK